MKSMVIFYRNLLKSISFSVVYISPLVILVSLIPNIKNSDFCELLFSLLLVFFCVYYSTKNAQKGIAAAFCTAAGNLIYYGFSKSFFSFVFVIILSVLFSKLFENMRISYGAAVAFISIFIFSYIMGVLHPYLFEYLKAFSKLIAGRGYVFGFINNVYDIFVSGNLSELFYHTAYSKSEVINNEIVSGAVDIFKAYKSNSVVSSYLTGKYFVNIFLSIGVFISVIKSMREDLKLPFLLTVLTSVISGDARLSSVFILAYNPALYVAYLIAVFVSYLVPPLINLNIGFIENGSIIELFRYGNSYGYFIATGIVLAVMSYLLSNFVVSKFKISHGMYYPKEVKKIISSLGNEDNIEKIENDEVFVSNPNLINILTLECDIHGKRVILNQEQLELIKEYF